jgi:hypothetical protein
MEPTKLQQALAQANGSRRTRLLGLDDIVSEAARLRPGQHIFLHGGHVANAYGYPAYATGAVVWKSPGKRHACCLVDVVPASRGSTGFGRQDSWAPPEDAGDVIRITPADKRTAG